MSSKDSDKNSETIIYSDIDHSIINKLSMLSVESIQLLIILAKEM